MNRFEELLDSNRVTTFSAGKRFIWKFQLMQ